MLAIQNFSNKDKERKGKDWSMLNDKSCGNFGALKYEISSQGRNHG